MILKIFLFWRFGLILVTYLGVLAIPLIANQGLGAVGESKSFSYLASWAQWDGGHYYQIAKAGYQTISDSAFFLLYPLLIRILKYLTFGNLIVSGLLISNIASLIFLIIF